VRQPVSYSHEGADHPVILRLPAHERGHVQQGGTEAYHTFSLGKVYDPARMGFRALRTINEEWIAPGAALENIPEPI